MLKKLRIRFVCIAMSFVTLMLSVILVMVFRFTQRSMEERSQRMLQSAMRLGPPEKREEGMRLPCLAVEVGRNGEITVAEDRQSLLEVPESVGELARQVLESGAQSGVLREHALRFHVGRTPDGHRIVFADISAEQDMLADLVKTCIALGLLGFCVFLVLSVLLAKWAVAPVEEAWNQQKQFIADASHELKTPLTVIMTNAELLQEACTPENLPLSQGILTVSRQMRTLVEGMLELARADNGSIRTCFARVDLSALVQRELLPFEPLFFEQDRSLDSRLQEGITVMGSETHLAQVVTVLLDNALKYSDPGSRVQVDLSRQGSHCLLSVTSAGAPISREDLKNIFKRFYRVSKARSRDGSYGLGLSIAQRIVTEHKGHIWAESENGRNTFRVLLPGN